MEDAVEPVPVGLVGAGPWAGTVHAPMLAAGPYTRLAGVWARRPQAAVELAGSGRAGSALLLGSDLGDGVFPEVARQFADTVRRGGGHPLDARHGLRLQEVIEEAERQLR
ncbi:hypothetical protein [Sphaerimonospora thailandensis]|uniref:Gfo/Idh/MocA-like oxidoreductase N-terminal domain-containing protein n=1 Tax=Sphaerimonospora thailandensis TaxID=795644 RepID=A0A8J3RER5_9ACTN|nr:hypothetical protein [Sphaerimonospora thailandensis]GIH71083.1 hypothetical protein Mth01_33360 [Sphaerimonospora thailandensis]